MVTGIIKKRTTALIVLAIAIPLFLALTTLFYGHVTFWYDNARDLQSAWDNLQKPTLIGPTSGIPGIFYGPYWIWLLSIGVLISKDPVVITFITATIPYFIIFPLVWFRLAKFFGLSTVIIGWLLFMLSTGLVYSTQLWNPYPAPLLTVLIIYLLIIVDHKKISKLHLAYSAFIGLLLGILINFHISFGIGLLLGVIIFLLWDLLYEIKRKFTKQFWISQFAYYGSICIGFFVAYLPALLFEVRHGFQQTQVLMHTLTKYGDVVAVKGLSKPLILEEFIKTFEKLLHVPETIAGLLMIVLPLSFIILLALKKILLTPAEKRIGMLLLSLFGGILFIYLTAKNPVWEYHFIGVDLVFVLALMFIIKKLSLVKIAAIFLVSVLIVSVSYTHYVNAKTHLPSGLNEQKEIVNLIKNDARSSDYTVIAYSSSIYMYEYSYLFRWLAGKRLSFDPSLNVSSGARYLIVPLKADPQVDDFFHFRAPVSQYKTEKILASKNFKILKEVKR
jgi:hypothetical protein